MLSEITIPRDGAVRFAWSNVARSESVSLLLIRTGAVPGYLRMKLSSDVGAYELQGLSRHQRYLCAIASKHDVSAWRSLTPRLGTAVEVEREKQGVAADIAKLTQLRVMPQNRRLTAFFGVQKGFVDELELSVKKGAETVLKMRVEPEVTSVVIDAARCQLDNGVAYDVCVAPRFGAVFGDERRVCVAPAPQGEERRANKALAQAGIVYPCLALGEEQDPFATERVSTGTGEQKILCCHCRTPVAWHDYRLRCRGCGAEFIPNGRGDFLDLARLRFGTCACCLPKKVLVSEPGSDALVCAHSQKEHMRIGGEQGFRLIEDLPFGLCQCCRPRRPLERKASGVVCTKTNEPHRATEGQGYVLVPSAPVFDAAAIDDLLDQGLAEISARGISRAR